MKSFSLRRSSNDPLTNNYLKMKVRKSKKRYQEVQGINHFIFSFIINQKFSIKFSNLDYEQPEKVHAGSWITAKTFKNLEQRVRYVNNMSYLNRMRNGGRVIKRNNNFVVNSDAAQCNVY